MPGDSHQYFDYDVRNKGSYQYSIESIDRAGNVSKRSSEQSITPGEFVLLTAKKSSRGGFSTRSFTRDGTDFILASAEAEVTISAAAGGIADPDSITSEAQFPYGSKYISSSSAEWTQAGNECGVAVSGVRIEIGMKDPSDSTRLIPCSFNESIKVTFTYDKANLPAGFGEFDLVPYRFNSETCTLERVDGSQNLYDCQITAMTSEGTDGGWELRANAYEPPMTEEFEKMGVSPYAGQFSNSDEGVSPETGALSLNITDARLAGANGLDLTIGRRYNSALAYAEYRDTKLNPSTSEERTKLGWWRRMGFGWELDIPWIETSENGMRIHFFGGISSDVGTKVSGSEVLGSSGYYKSVKYVHFSEDDSEETFWTHSYLAIPEQRNSDRIYDVETRKGLKYRFVKNRLVMVQDQNGNTLRYDYDGYGRLSKIADIGKFDSSNGSLESATVIRSIRLAYYANKINACDRLEWVTWDGSNQGVDNVTLNVHYLYDTNGQLYKVVDPEGATAPAGQEPPEHTTVYGYLESSDAGSQTDYPPGGSGLWYLVSDETKIDVVYAEWIQRDYDTEPHLRQVSDFVQGQILIPDLQDPQWLIREIRYPSQGTIRYSYNCQKYANTVSGGSSQDSQFPGYSNTVTYNKAYNRTWIAVTKKEEYKRGETTPSSVTSYALTRKNASGRREYVATSSIGQGNRIVVNQYELLGNKTAEQDNRVTRAVSSEVKTVDSSGSTSSESFVQYQYSASGKLLTAESHYLPTDHSKLLYQVIYGYDQYYNLAYKENGATGLKEWWGYSNSSPMPLSYYTSGFQPLQTFDFANAQNEGVRLGILACVTHHSVLNEVPTPGSTSTQKVQTQYDYWDTTGWTGNLEQERQWNGQKWCPVFYKYNPNGTVQEKTEGTNGPKTTYSYSGPNGAFLAGASVTVHDVDGNASDIVTSYQYYVDGQQSQETDPRGKTTMYQYDRLGRLTEVTRPDGLKRFYAWRDEEDFCYVTDQVSAGKQQTTKYEFDGLGHIRFVTQDYQASPVSGSKTANTKTEYQYDSSWQVSAVVEPHEAGEELITNRLLRYTASYEYDALGRVRKVSFPYDAEKGEAQQYAQLSYGIAQINGEYVNQTTILDELRHKTVETKDLGGRLISAAVDNISQLYGAPAAQTWAFAYDGLGRRVYSKTPGGKEVWSNYDELGRLTKSATQPISVMSPESDVVLQLPITSAYGYDDRGNRVWEIGPNGHLGSSADVRYKIEYQYDELNRLIRATEPLSDAQSPRITKVYYDGCGNKVKVVDGNGLETSYTYDARGRLLTEKNPAGEIATCTYDGVGNRTSVTDPRGSATTTIDGDFTTWYVYDNLNRLTRAVLPDSDVPADPFGEPVYNNPYTETTYTRSGLKETERNPNGVIKRYEYNARKWLKQVIVNGVVLSTNEYDDVGRVTKTTDAEGTSIYCDYDYLGNVLRKRLVGTDEITTVYGYDADGNKASETDGYDSSKFTRFEYDSLGRLSRTIKANSGATQYTYDPAGALRRVTDAKGYSSFSYYNRLGWLVREKDSLQKETSCTYDLGGRRIGGVDRKGQTSTYSYYNSGRLQEVSFSDGVRIAYEYDAAGNKTRVVQTGTSQTIETKYNYDEAIHSYVADPQNRVNTVVRSIGTASCTTRYGYDMAGNVARVLYPGSSQWIEYNRDSFDRVVEVPGFTQSPSAGKSGVEYDKTGVMTRLTLANGIQLDVTPDKFHRPVIMNYHKVGQVVPPGPEAGVPVSTPSNEHRHDLQERCQWSRDGAVHL